MNIACATEIRLTNLYLSAGHNYFGRHGRDPSDHPMIEVSELECVAGAGIVGDRFLNFKENYKGQITFFAYETYEELCERFNVRDKTPAVFRRNVITRGCDLNSLIGAEFEIQGIRFLGTEHCKPCYWMDRAFSPGAEAAMDGKGGLRARILTSGNLRTDD